MKINKLHTRCRICSSTHLIEYLNLGRMPLPNNLEFTEQLAKDKERFPLEVMFCEECGLSQLSVVIDPNELFSYYTYRSGINKGYIEHCHKMAEELVSRFGFDETTYHIDVAGNDGTLLIEFRKVLHNDDHLFNVDPAVNLKDISQYNRIFTISQFWNTDLAVNTFKGRADLITATNVFAHLDDVDEFLQACKLAMKPEGIIVIENPYLIDFIDKMEWDTCFLPDATILGPNTNIGECKVGDKVYSSEGTLTEVTHIFKRNYSGEILTIKGDYLEEIKCTPNHPILITKDRGITKKFIEASKINIGDYLCVPKVKSNNLTIILDLSEYNKLGSNWRRGLLSVDINEDFAYLVGLYTADGSTGKDMLSIALSHSQRETIGKKLISIVNKLGIHISVYDRTKWGSKCDTYNFPCMALIRLFKEKIGKKAHNKMIPDFILNSNKHIKESYLRGLFDGDGYYKDGQIHLHTSSKILALQVQLMFVEFNIIMGISCNPPHEYNIMGKTGSAKADYQLRAKSKIVRKFFKDETITKFNIRYTFDNDYLYVKINNIQNKFYEGLVYNLETKDHTYLVSNIVVHNCYFEHLTYWSLIPMVRVCSNNGLKVISAEKQAIHGGSMRYIISDEHSNYTISPAIENLFKEERRREFDKYETYKIWAAKVKNFIRDFKYNITDLKKQGKKIIAFAASAKGNTLLNSAEVGKGIIDCIIDETPEKIGKFYPGVGIPIIGIENIMKISPDYILILSWNFKEEIIEKVKSLGYKKNFIVPIPRWEVI